LANVGVADVATIAPGVKESLAWIEGLCSQLEEEYCLHCAQNVTEEEYFCAGNSLLTCPLCIAAVLGGLCLRLLLAFPFLMACQ